MSSLDRSLASALADHPEVRAVLDDLLDEVRVVLAADLVGVYLTGSLASGDFDRASDVDLVVVTESQIEDEQLELLDALHRRIAQRDEWCATQVECTYIARAALRRFDPALARYVHIERGADARLQRVEYDEGWLVQAYLLGTLGITLAGPAPGMLIDEVSPASLRSAMRVVLAEWATAILDHPESLQSRIYQSYVVLAICRIRFTLQSGEIASKRRAAEWARHALPERWHSLIERALMDRELPAGLASEDAVSRTREFVRDTVDAAARAARNSVVHD